MPPYEWWNDSIAAWSKTLGLQVFCFTPEIRTNTDYTYPEMSKYKSSDWIMQSLKDQQQKNADAFNGAVIIVHAGTDARRKDKLYDRLGEMIDWLRSEGYSFKRIDQLLK
jgi:peptidoglycan/xylan/chitin deacetylase (PgdA/CDA1 family)